MSGPYVDCGHGVRLERGVRCRMSDGVQLVSNHYHPPGDGPHPVLLMRQPYGRDIASTVVYSHPAWFARQGFLVVIQDVRGRGDSEGEFYPFRHEARDGAETIAWLRTLAESNGRIGMYGFSYHGATQLLAAAEQPEGLVCIAPGMTAGDLYHRWFYQNGALRFAPALGWGLQMLKADTRRLQLREASDRLESAWADLSRQTGFLPFRDHPAIHGEGVPKYVADWFDHTQPGAYWSALDVSDKIDRIRIPALHISGWYDIFVGGSIGSFRALRSGDAGEHQYLIAGPWIHIPWGDRAGSANFGVQALLDTDSILLRWFNHWLKDSQEFASEPRVRHFVLGENRWRTSDDFAAAEHKLFLRGNGRANSRKGNGILSASAPQGDEPPDIFVYDPEVPVTAPGGPTAPAGSFDQAGMELGNNMLVYTSEPLTEPLWILGAPRVFLYCVSSAGSTDFTAKLVRVRSDGPTDFICLGIARSNFLFSGNGYAPDKVHLWSFDLEPTSCRFDSGERIRLEIASSAFPLFDRNPGTEVPSPRATSWDWQRSTQFVYHTRELCSAVALPVESIKGKSIKNGEA